MPQQDDNDIQDLDSSPGSDDLDAKVTETEQASETSDAGSSDATGDNDADRSMLDVVRDVVDKNAPEPAEAASPAEGEEDGQAADETPKKEQDDENFSDVPFHKHPRFQQLLNKSKTYEADAQRYQNVQGFLDENGVSAEEAADILLVAALAKTNPTKALELVKPWLQNLLHATGEVLPDDLNQRVQNGELSRETALEVSRLRAQNQSVQAQQTFAQQRAEQERAAAHATSLVTAAESWVSYRQSRDPNFDAKQPQLMREIAYLQRTEGKPDTADGVKDQLKRAYDSVNESFRPPAPTPVRQQRPAVRPVTGGQVSGSGAKPVFNSTLDIVRAKNRAAS